ncbi:MAG: hypothetical protein AAB436_01230 [Patescibacteria group bacterium]
MSPLVKRYITVLVVVVVGFFVFTAVWRYLHTGRLVITTANPSSYITVKSAEDDQKNNKSVLGQSQGQIRIRLPAGKYVVSIQGNRAILVSKLVEVEARKTLYYELKTPLIGAAEPVASVDAQNLVVNGSRLRYLDNESDNLSEISSQNPVPSAISGKSFESVTWADTGYGVAEDESGRLYEVDEGTLRAITLPKTSSNKDKVIYAVASNHRLYVAIGSDIYTSLGSSLKKIYTTEVGAPVLAASPDRLAIISTPQYGDGEDQPGFVEVISNSGRKLAESPAQADQAVWSPDGSKLVAVNYSGGSRVYDSKLNEIVELPNRSIKTAAWSGNNTVLFGVDNELWSYGVGSGQARVLATVTKGDVLEISVTPDRSFAYLITKSEEGSAISRFGLKDQKPDEVTGQLDIFLPLNLLACNVSYTNFAQPVIILQPFSPDSIENCRSAATSTLSDYQLDVSKLRFVDGPVFDQTD